MKKSILSFMLALSLFSSVLFSACSSGESSAVYNNSIVLKAVKDADLNSDDNTEVKKVLENRLTEMNITKYAVETDEEAKTFTVKYTPEEKQTIDEKLDFYSEEQRIKRILWKRKQNEREQPQQKKPKDRGYER